MVAAFAKGLEGTIRSIGRRPVAQAFPGNSNEDHRDASSSNFDQWLFWEYYSVLSGWDSGRRRKAVMASYNAWNGTAMAINPVLKSGGSRQVERGRDFERRRSDQAARRSAPSLSRSEGRGGCVSKSRINQFLDRYKDETKEALKDGTITEAEIDTLLRPKFRITIRLGLLDPPEMFLIRRSKTRRSPGTPRRIAPSRNRWRWNRWCCSRTRTAFCLSKGCHQVDRHHRAAGLLCHWTGTAARLRMR